MEDWDRAIAYADSVLQVKPNLLDLNTVSWSTPRSPSSLSVYSIDTPDEVIWMREGYRKLDDMQASDLIPVILLRMIYWICTVPAIIIWCKIRRSRIFAGASILLGISKWLFRR